MIRDVKNRIDRAMRIAGSIACWFLSVMWAHAVLIDLRTGKSADVASSLMLIFALLASAIGEAR